MRPGRLWRIVVAVALLGGLSSAGSVAQYEEPNPFAQCYGAWTGPADQIQVSTQCQLACAYDMAEAYAEKAQACDVVRRMNGLVNCSVCQ